MTPGKFDLNLYRGDTWQTRVRLWADAAATDPVDLTGATAAAQLRDKLDGVDVLDVDCEVIAPNEVFLTLTPELWATAPAKLTVWDLEITYPDTTVATVLAGKVNVTSDVTL